MSNRKAEYHPAFFSILRPLALIRDNFTCQNCGHFDPANHVHHINGNKQDPNFANLITLCHPCHNKATAGRLKFYNRPKIEQLELADLFYLLEQPPGTWKR